MDELVEQIVSLALREDIRNGDITTQAVFSGNETTTGTFWCKESGVIAGLELAEYIFKRIDPEIRFNKHINDGEAVTRGDVLAEVSGPADSILTGERTVLNFMQRMSGVATKTATFVEAISHTKTKLLDTRKTIPGHRYLDKWAVRLGGGKNHRYCLDDMYLIKDNHIAVAGGITKAIAACIKHKERNGFSWKIEVEVTTHDQLKEAIETGNVDFVLLDNMNLKQLQKSVEIVGGRVKTEASGNMTLDRVPKVAETGVDFISVGALTHSVKALDISLLFD
jgi:nicotinate-nucleotide pyrophosphorylase (carboxylating)